MGEKESQGCATRHVREMLIITARAWAMIDAVGDNFFVIHDCGDIGENGYGQGQDGDNDDGSG